jgi:hypothetical protein
MNEYRNATVLDNLVGTQGLKTDVQISLPPVTWLYFGAALFIGIVASQVVIRAILGK